jgi:hypothetical protein
MGISGAANRSLSSQRIHGHNSNRCRRDLHRFCTQVGAPALAVAPSLVAALVYPASSGVPLNARSYLLQAG